MTASDMFPQLILSRAAIAASSIRAAEGVMVSPVLLSMTIEIRLTAERFVANGTGRARGLQGGVSNLFKGNGTAVGGEDCICRSYNSRSQVSVKAIYRELALVVAIAIDGGGSADLTRGTNSCFHVGVKAIYGRLALVVAIGVKGGGCDEIPLENRSADLARENNSCSHVGIDASWWNHGLVVAIVIHGG